MTSPRVYVADLAAYNAGHLVGEWVEATDSDALEAAIQKASHDGQHDWAIHDHEGFAGVDIGENMDADSLVELATFLEEHGEEAAAYIAHVGIEHWSSSGFDDAYRGTYGSGADWAEGFLSDTGALEGLGSELRGYFDFEKYARDCELSGDVAFCDLPSGNVAVFDNR